MARTSVFVIENVIASYPHLFEAKPYMGPNGQPQGDPKYSIAGLITPEAAEFINAKAMECAQEAYPKGEFNHATFGWPCQPANLKEEFANNPRTANLWRINATANLDFKPSVVDENRQPVLDRGTIYAGCIVALGIQCFSRPQPARPGEVGLGIGIGLTAVMKTGDGEPLGSSVDAASLFGDVKTTGAPANFVSPNGGALPATGAAPTNFGNPTTPADASMPDAPFGAPTNPAATPFG